MMFYKHAALNLSVALSVVLALPAYADSASFSAIGMNDASSWTIGTLCRGNNPRCGGGGGSTDPVVDEPEVSQPTYYNWMSPEIRDAWSQGATGLGTVVTSIDDFNSNNRFRGNLGDGSKRLRHGEWVDAQIGMIAPDAVRATQDFNSGKTVRLTSGKLNTLNLSYGMFGQAGYLGVIGWSNQEKSIIDYATKGTAVVVKAAGNDSVAIGATNANGLVDYLNRDLIGAQSAIFVGALDRNGTQSNQARLASYSNFAGTNATVQNQFLTVGVRGDLTGLYGTSFAAPVISGYAAVIGSKFTTATPTMIAQQLLKTARTDTIEGYSAAVHGRGEASIAHAIAPASIN